MALDLYHDFVLLNILRTWHFYSTKSTAAVLLSDYLTILVLFVFVSEYGIKLRCVCKGYSAPLANFIYPNGNIPGAMLYWYDRPVVEVQTTSYSYNGNHNAR